MRRVLSVYALLLLLLTSVRLEGQTKMGDWRTHLPYLNAEVVEKTNFRVYCSTTGGLFTYNLVDHSIEKLSKIDGFSDVGVQAMRWNGEKSCLLIAYQNANLDLLRNGVISNIPDIMQKQIPGDKTIYDIYYDGDYAYLSTGFGIVVLNVEKEEIKETYIIGDNGDRLRVNQVSIGDGYIYAATDQGIRRGLLDDPFLVDFNAWELLTDIPNYSGRFNAIAHYEGALFASYKDPAGVQDVVYYKPDEEWLNYPYLKGNECREILNQGPLLSIVQEHFISLVNETFLVSAQMWLSNPISATLDDAWNLWVADDGLGLMTNSGGESWAVVPDGPESKTAYEMAFAENKLYTVRGGIDGTADNQYELAAMEKFADHSWTTYEDEESRDLVAVAIDPADPDHVFAGSWGYGLYEYRPGEEVKRYTEANSSLQSIMAGDFIRIGGLAFDPLGNLWMTNSNVEKPISVRKADGQWVSYRAENTISSYPALGRIMVSRSGHKWAIIRGGHGLFAMDDNGTIDDIQDDEYKRISVVDKYGKVITNDIRSFAEDHNGNLWLGTNQGILVIYSPHRLFTEGSVYAQEIIVPRNDGSGLGDVLLGSQVVTSIEVDGANRKWLGTSGGGVYLVSEDGLQELHHFNELNSPLLSDNIIDISVNGENGEVFFATEKGIISYHGEALAGNENYANVVVYPNPVRETYWGPIAIKGLVENTTVKIQDMSGNIVFEIQSLGGQAIWDGRNFRGHRVATGVYLIFLSSEDGSMSHVTKLLFIH